MSTCVSRCRVKIAVGGVCVAVDTMDPAFLRMLEERYAGFLDRSATPADCEFEVELDAPEEADPDQDVRVYHEGGLWRLERGDFRAQWDPVTRRGRVRQAASPYAIDTVLRVVHTLVLAREGGFLVHAASAVRDGKAFLFAGVSGAGKTTISRLAPAGVKLLTDEISYVRKEAGGYFAYGTPFAGDLGRAGENVRAPLAGIFLLTQGAGNEVADIAPAEAARGILGCILFFAEDAELVRSVFLSSLELVERVPVRQLTFVPDARVWELIR